MVFFSLRSSSSDDWRESTYYGTHQLLSAVLEWRPFSFRPVDLLIEASVLAALKWTHETSYNGTGAGGTVGVGMVADFSPVEVAVKLRGTADHTWLNRADSGYEDYSGSGWPQSTTVLVWATLEIWFKL